MRRRTCCPWWLPVLLMIPLFFLVAAISKHSIESGLANRARAALSAHGLGDISVAGSKWGDLRLTGPASKQADALAAVEAMGHRGDANRITYSGDGVAEPAAPTTTTTAAATTSAAVTVTTTTAAPTITAVETTTTVAQTTTAATTTTTAAAPTAVVDATAVTDAKKVTLSGYVANAAERSALVTAATAAYGAPNVVDQLTVKTTTPTAPIDGAVAQLGGVISAFGSKVQTGQAHLVDTVLTVTGTAFTRQAADDVTALLATAKAAGLTTNGSVTAPAAPDAASLQAQLKDLLGRSGINFASGRAELTPASAAILDTAAQSILQVSGVKIGVGGYTDDVGSPASNQGLSQRRAEAVRAYLIDKGVPAAQLTAFGFGQNNPIAPNDTDQGRASNRRIEFTVGS